LDSDTIVTLREKLSDPSYGRSQLAWLETLRTPKGYRLWRKSEPHLLPTCFAYFLRELFNDLPAPDSMEAHEACVNLLNVQTSSTGLFDRNLGEQRGPHGSTYLILQQTHFALQALRLLGFRHKTLPFLDSWKTKEGLEAEFNNLDWRNPWKESNRVMFLLYFYEHAIWAGIPGPWQERIQDALNWLEREQHAGTGLWGIDAESRVYNAIYGAYHFLFFFLHYRDAMPRADLLLGHTRKLQTKEGFFAHTSGGGACEDYDCVDMLIKLGNDDDKIPLLRCAEAVLAGQNPDGAYGWATPTTSGIPFLLGNYQSGLSLIENRKLLLQRLRGSLPGGRMWRYSSIEALACPMEESDIWSTWFRNLILAEIDDHFIGSTRAWTFRTFPSLGWHRPSQRSSS
jgi:hypothetical protein